MTLSDSAIKSMLGNGIEITPFDEKQLGPNSYDVRVGPEYWERQSGFAVTGFSGPKHYVLGEDPLKVWSYQRNDIILKVQPGETILAHTIEEVAIGPQFVAKLYARSSIGRSGLSVCKCAGLIDSGYRGRITMEISNHQRYMIHIPVRMRIAQIVFEEVQGNIEHPYAGKYGHKRGEWTPYDMLPKLEEDYDRR